MTRLTRRWLATLVALDVLAWVLTIHAHLTFHRAPGGPSTMTVGQALGWFFSVGLLLLIVVILLEHRRARRAARRDADPRGSRQ